jgi:hypothetical protein
MTLEPLRFKGFWPPPRWPSALNVKKAVMARSMLLFRPHSNPECEALPGIASAPKGESATAAIQPPAANKPLGRLKGLKILATA